uniref:Secreted protein n=1 Tax=Ascaris lumbricoides TaxID=6252 RepID=A0A0M3HXK2_ASCLU
MYKYEILFIIPFFCQKSICFLYCNKKTSELLVASVLVDLFCFKNSYDSNAPIHSSSVLIIILGDISLYTTHWNLRQSCLNSVKIC